MKKLILFLMLFALVALTGFGQSSPSDQLRVRTKVTAFQRDIPIGTTVFFVSDSTYYVAVHSVAKATTFDDHVDYWRLIGGGGEGSEVTAFDIVEEFTETAAADSGTTHCLVGIPLTNSVMVELNGSTLSKGNGVLWSTKDFVLNLAGLGAACNPTGSGKVYIRVPVYEFDKIRIRYRYTELSGTPL